MKTDLEIIKEIETKLNKNLEYKVDINENVISLSLTFLDISDIEILKNFKKLEILNLTKNQIKDISVLKNLTNLTRLNLSYNQITDISSLRNLKNLTYLNLADCKITDISILKELTNLKDLWLWYNQIIDISALGELKKLEKLFLSKNKIVDISALSELKNLSELWLENNKIKILPEWILDFPYLGNFNSIFENNPIENVPVGIIAKGKKEIRKYFQKNEPIKDWEENTSEKYITFESLETHFKEINIKQYKALSGLQFKNLNKINIIAGLNNSGKTSLLEAIYLLCSQNDFGNYIELQRMRAKYISLKDISLSFLEKHTLETIEIEGIFSEKNVKIEILKFDSLEETENNPSYRISYKINSFIQDDGKSKWGNISGLKTKIHLFGEKFSKHKIVYRVIRNLCKIEYFSPFIYQLREKTKDAHNKSVDKKSFEKIIKYINEKVDSNIENITLTLEENDIRFKVSDVRFAEARDLTEYGDGMQRMFAIALQFASVENGVLLIDEFENGIDFKNLVEYAGFIIDLSLLFNVQVFLTSHSKECIDAFFANKNNLQKISGYTITRENDNLVVQFAEGQLYARLIKSMDVDLRRGK